MKPTLSMAILSDGMFPFHTGGMQSHTKNVVEDLSVFYDCIYLGLPKNKLLKEESQVLEQFSPQIQQKLRVFLVDRPSSPIPFPGAYLLEEIRLSNRLNQSLARLAKDVKYIYAQGFTGWNRKYRAAPVLVHLHGYEFMQAIPNLSYRLKSKFLGLFFRSLIKKADYVISLGGKITDIILRLGVHKSRIIQHLNGLNELPQKGIKEEGKAARFLFVARNEKRKGFDDLVAAWKSYGGDGHLDVVGNYDSIESLKNTTFYGEIKDRDAINAIYKKADFIILPSHAEGMPMVLLEAACFGCIPICTNVGAIGSYFNQQNAIWIEPGNSQSIKQGILKAEGLGILDLDNMRNDFANTAHCFTRESCSNQLFEQLQEKNLS